jgi:hypothetical protein
MPNIRMKATVEPTTTFAAVKVSPSGLGPYPSACSRVQIIVSKSPQPLRLRFGVQPPAFSDMPGSITPGP